MLTPAGVESHRLHEEQHVEGHDTSNNGSIHIRQYQVRFAGPKHVGHQETRPNLLIWQRCVGHVVSYIH